MNFVDESVRAEVTDADLEGEVGEARVLDVAREHRGGRGVRGMRVGRARRGVLGRGM